MKFSICIEKFIGKSLIVLTLIGFPQLLCAQSDVSLKNKNLVNKNYISAFATPTDICDSVAFISCPDSMYYTIQICSIDFYIHDSILTRNNKIQTIPMGDIYRYIFSIYPTLTTARKALSIVRHTYPDAFIREYKAGKLGMAIDLNIEQIRINN